MKVYMFKAALYCQSCGEQACNDTPKPAGMDPDNEHTWDSDDYPKGPFGDGGGEADSPQHCDDCGEFLENPLTRDGDDWLREQAKPYEVEGDTWDETAANVIANKGGAHLAQWIRFYLGSG